MLNLGDKPDGIASQRVKHQETGNIGIVVGFGKRIINNKCLPTTKVKIVDSESERKTIVRDLDTKWMLFPQDFKAIYPEPLNKYRVHKFNDRKVRVKTA
ncbi:MAG: hypothetical protein AAF383_09725 [Cyanobacteria bacterium P01_A01_bin.83]